METRETRAILARNLRALARERKMTLTRLADFAQVSKQQLFNVLASNTNASIDILTRLANVLEVEPWQLLAPRPPARKGSRPAR